MMALLPPKERQVCSPNSTAIENSDLSNCIGNPLADISAMQKGYFRHKIVGGAVVEAFIHRNGRGYSWIECWRYFRCISRHVYNNSNGNLSVLEHFWKMTAQHSTNRITGTKMLSRPSLQPFVAFPVPIFGQYLSVSLLNAGYFGIYAADCKILQHLRDPLIVTVLIALYRGLKNGAQVTRQANRCTKR